MFPVRSAVPVLVVAVAFLTTVATASAQFTPSSPAAPEMSPSLSSLPSSGEASLPPLVPDSAPAAQTYTSMIVRRDTTVDLPDGISRRTVYEPSIGSQGNAILTTGNYQAQLSTNNGMSWRYINPATEFPALPSAFGAGFCCDQRVAQDSTRNLVFWYLQYRATGEQSDSTNGVRIAVYRGAGGLTLGTPRLIDFTPADFELPLGSWLDFPDMQVGANYLYFTSNVYTTTRDDKGNFALLASIIGRLSLDALASGASVDPEWYKTSDFGSIAPVNGAGATMYFGSITGATIMTLLRWRDSDPQPVRVDMTGLRTPISIPPITRALVLAASMLASTIPYLPTIPVAPVAVASSTLPPLTPSSPRTPVVRTTRLPNGDEVGGTEMGPAIVITRPPEAYFTPTPGGVMPLPPHNVEGPPPRTPDPRTPTPTDDPRILPVDTTFTPPYPTPWWVTPGVGTVTPVP